MNYNRCKIRLNAELGKLRKLRGAGGCRGALGGRWWDGEKKLEGGRKIWGGQNFLRVVKFFGVGILRWQKCWETTNNFLRGGTIHSAWQIFFRLTIFYGGWGSISDIYY